MSTAPITWWRDLNRPSADRTLHRAGPRTRESRTETDRAPDQFPRSEVWSALYMAFSPEASLGEVIRHFTPQLLPQLNEYRLSEIEVELEAVLDYRDAAALGLSPQELSREYDFAITQEIAAIAIAKGAEGILVPSATGLGDNLAVFPVQLRTGSMLAVTGSRDPRLYVPR